MEFKPQNADGRPSEYKLFIQFDIAPAEVERARMGFEIIGNAALSEEVDKTPRMGISAYKKARLTVAGNIALINALANSGTSEAVENMRQVAQRTVETGLSAILEADAAMVAEPNYI